MMLRLPRYFSQMNNLGGSSQGPSSLIPNWVGRLKALYCLLLVNIRGDESINELTWEMCDRKGLAHI